MKLLINNDGNPYTIYVSEEMSEGSFNFTDGENPSATLSLIIKGTSDPFSAHIASVQYLRQRFYAQGLGINYKGIPLSNVNVSSTASNFAYRANCTFEFPPDNANRRDRGDTGVTPENPIINEPDFVMPEVEPRDLSFSTTGGSYRRVRAISQVFHAAQNVEAGGHEKMIGFNGEGYDGVEVIEPSIVYTISISAPQSFFSFEYRNTLIETTGCVNSRPWDGFDACEVLFRGATVNPTRLSYTDYEGNQINDWYWRITYEFEARKSEFIEFDFETSVDDKGVVLVDQPVIPEEPEEPAPEVPEEPGEPEGGEPEEGGDPVPEVPEVPEEPAGPKKGFHKKGFQYVWFLNETKVEGDGDRVIQKPVQAVVSEVYPRVDFSVLQIPGLILEPEEPEEPEKP